MCFADECCQWRLPVLVQTAIATSEGPVSQATQAEYVKFHDDKVPVLRYC